MGYINLLHLRARWYSVGTGTFLSVDPVESEPPYLYVRGNPLNRVDPAGFQSPEGTRQPSEQGSSNPELQPTEISVPNIGPTPTPQPPWPYCLSELGSNPPDPPEYCVPPPQPPPSPPNDCACKDANVRRISLPNYGGFNYPKEIIVLPPGTPTDIGPFKNRTAATIFGSAGVVGDSAEFATLVPVPGVSQVVSIGDTVLGLLASASSGESYPLQRPHDCLPPMTIIGQDAIVPASDLAIGTGAEIIGTMVGTFAGYIVAKELDALMTVGGGYYDLRRLPDESREQIKQQIGDYIPMGPIPTYVATGVSWENGNPHLVYLIYEQ